MAQGMLLRERTPSPFVSAFNIHPHSSLEEKLMLYHLFDRHDRFNSSNPQETSTTNNQMHNLAQGNNTVIHLSYFHYYLKFQLILHRVIMYH